MSENRERTIMDSFTADQLLKIKDPSELNQNEAVWHPDSSAEDCLDTDMSNNSQDIRGADSEKINISESLISSQAENPELTSPQNPPTSSIPASRKSTKSRRIFRYWSPFTMQNQVTENRELVLKNPEIRKRLSKVMRGYRVTRRRYCAGARRQTYRGRSEMSTSTEQQDMRPPTENPNEAREPIVINEPRELNEEKVPKQSRLLQWVSEERASEIAQIDDGVPRNIQLSVNTESVSHGNSPYNIEIETASIVKGYGNVAFWNRYGSQWGNNNIQTGDNRDRTGNVVGGASGYTARGEDCNCCENCKNNSIWTDNGDCGCWATHKKCGCWLTTEECRCSVTTGKSGRPSPDHQSEGPSTSDPSTGARIGTPSTGARFCGTSTSTRFGGTSTDAEYGSPSIGAMFGTPSTYARFDGSSTAARFSTPSIGAQLGGRPTDARFRTPPTSAPFDSPRNSIRCVGLNSGATYDIPLNDLPVRVPCVDADCITMLTDALFGNSSTDAPFGGQFNYAQCNGQPNNASFDCPLRNAHFNGASNSAQFGDSADSARFGGRFRGGPLSCSQCGRASNGAQSSGPCSGAHFDGPFHSAGVCGPPNSGAEFGCPSRSAHFCHPSNSAHFGCSNNNVRFSGPSNNDSHLGGPSNDGAHFGDPSNNGENFGGPFSGPRFGVSSNSTPLRGPTTGSRFDAPCIITLSDGPTIRSQCDGRSISSQYDDCSIRSQCDGTSTRKQCDGPPTNSQFGSPSTDARYAIIYNSVPLNNPPSSETPGSPSVVIPEQEVFYSQYRCIFTTASYSCVFSDTKHVSISNPLGSPTSISEFEPPYPFTEKPWSINTHTRHWSLFTDNDVLSEFDDIENPHDDHRDNEASLPTFKEFRNFPYFNETEDSQAMDNDVSLLLMIYGRFLFNDFQHECLNVSHISNEIFAESDTSFPQQPIASSMEYSQAPNTPSEICDCVSDNCIYKIHFNKQRDVLQSTIPRVYNYLNTLVDIVDESGIIEGNTRSIGTQTDELHRNEDCSMQPPKETGVDNTESARDQRQNISRNNMQISKEIEKLYRNRI